MKRWWERRGEDDLQRLEDLRSGKSAESMIRFSQCCASYMQLIFGFTALRLRKRVRKRRAVIGSIGVKRGGYIGYMRIGLDAGCALFWE